MDLKGSSAGLDVESVARSAICALPPTIEVSYRLHAIETEVTTALNGAQPVQDTVSSPVAATAAPTPTVDGRTLFVPKELLRIIIEYAAPSGPSIHGKTIPPYQYNDVTLNGVRSSVHAQVVLNTDFELDALSTAGGYYAPRMTRLLMSFDDTPRTILKRILPKLKPATPLGVEDLILQSACGATAHVSAQFYTDENVRLWDYDSVRLAVRYELPVTFLVRSRVALKREADAELKAALASTARVTQTDSAPAAAATATAADTKSNRSAAVVVQSVDVARPLVVDVRSFSFIKGQPPPPPSPMAAVAATASAPSSSAAAADALAVVQAAERAVDEYRHIRIDTFFGYGVSVVGNSVAHFGSLCEPTAVDASASDAKVHAAAARRTLALKRCRCGCESIPGGRVSSVKRVFPVPPNIANLPLSTKLFVAVYDCTARARAAARKNAMPAALAAAPSALDHTSSANFSTDRDSKTQPVNTAMTYVASPKTPAAPASAPADLPSNPVSTSPFTTCTECAGAGGTTIDRLIGYAVVPLWTRAGDGHELVAPGEHRVKLRAGPRSTLSSNGFKRKGAAPRFAPDFFRVSVGTGGLSRLTFDGEAWVYASTDPCDDANAPEIVISLNVPPASTEQTREISLAGTSERIVYGAAARSPTSPSSPPPATDFSGITRVQAKTVVYVIDATWTDQLRFASRFTTSLPDDPTKLQQQLLWQFRYPVLERKLVPLPTFLTFIDYANVKDLDEVYALMKAWPILPLSPKPAAPATPPTTGPTDPAAVAPTAEPHTALERTRIIVRTAVTLLDVRFHDPAVRAFAVRWLTEHASTKHDESDGGGGEDVSLLASYWNQLLEATKIELYDDSPLFQFIVASAVRHPRELAHPLIWWCRTELDHRSEYRTRIAKLLDAVWRGLDVRWRARIDAQRAFARVLGAFVSEYLTHRGLKRPADYERKLPVPDFDPNGPPLPKEPTPVADWKAANRQRATELSARYRKELNQLFESCGGVIRSPANPSVELTGVDVMHVDDDNDYSASAVQLRVSCTVAHALGSLYSFRVVTRDVRGLAMYGATAHALDEMMLSSGIDLCFPPPVRAVALGALVHPLTDAADDDAVELTKGDLVLRKWFVESTDDRRSIRMHVGMIESGPVRSMSLSEIYSEFGGGAIGALKSDSVVRFLQHYWVGPKPAVGSDGQVIPQKPPPTPVPATAVPPTAATDIKTPVTPSASGAGIFTPAEREWERLVVRSALSIAGAQLMAGMLQPDINNSTVAVDVRGRVFYAGGDSIEVFGQPPRMSFGITRERTPGGMINGELLFILGGRRFSRAADYKRMRHASEAAHRWFVLHGGLLELEARLGPYRQSGIERSFCHQFETAMGVISTRVSQVNGYGDGTPVVRVVGTTATPKLATTTGGESSAPAAAAASDADPTPPATITVIQIGSNQPAAKRIASAYDHFLDAVIDRAYRRMDTFMHNIRHA